MRTKTTMALIAAALSWVAFYRVGYLHEETRVPLFSWIVSGDLNVAWSLRIDTLTAVMLVVVTTVSSLVHLYSIGYMHEDDSRARFFESVASVDSAHASTLSRNAASFDRANTR